MSRILIILFLMPLIHCGYTLNHRLIDHFKDERGIYVPVFDNKSEEVGAERVFTNALIRELRGHGEIMVTAREEGGLELFGTLASLDIAPTATTAPGYAGLAPYRKIPSEMGVTAHVSLKLTDPKNGKVLWTGGFSSFRRAELPIDRTYDYQAPSTLFASHQSVSESLFADVARDIMRDAYDEMLELFE